MRKSWLLLLMAPLLLVACATTGKDDFLKTDDPAWRARLDEKVDIDVDNVDLAALFCQTPAFADLDIMVLPRNGVAVANEDAAFDDPVEKLRVTLHQAGVTRREVLRQLAHDGSLRMRLAARTGQPMVLIITAR